MAHNSGPNTIEPLSLLSRIHSDFIRRPENVDNENSLPLVITFRCTKRAQNTNANATKTFHTTTTTIVKERIHIAHTHTYRHRLEMIHLYSMSQSLLLLFLMERNGRAGAEMRERGMFGMIQHQQMYFILHKISNDISLIQ